MMTIVFGTVLPWLLIAIGTWLAYQFVRQTGRILVRLEAIEQRIGPGSQSKRQEGSGLPLGTIAPNFELPDLAGVRRKLSEFRGQDVLLVFFNPQCGYCTQMATDLAALPAEGSDRRAVPVVVTTGDGEENRKLVERYGIRCLVLLQEQMEVAAMYGATGTPMGYRIDGAGASPASWPRAPNLCCDWQPRSRPNWSNRTPQRTVPRRTVRTTIPRWHAVASTAAGCRPARWRQNSACRELTKASWRWPTSEAVACCLCFPIPTAVPAMSWRRNYKRFTCSGQSCRCWR